jgi:hypothetical protein
VEKTSCSLSVRACIKISEAAFFSVFSKTPSAAACVGCYLTGLFSASGRVRRHDKPSTSLFVIRPPKIYLSAIPTRIEHTRGALSFSRLGLIRLPALVNGAAGLVCMLEGKPFAVMAFTVRGGKIAEIDILRDPERLSQLDLTVLDG